MLDVTIRVTRTPTHLEQIHQISIVNKGEIEPGNTACMYEMTVDGEYQATVVHYPENGAITLLSLALEAYNRKRR